MTSTSNFENQSKDPEEIKEIFELLTIKGLLNQLHTAAVYENNAYLFTYIQLALQDLVSTIPNTGYKNSLATFINKDRPIGFNQQSEFVIELNRLVNWTARGIEQEIKLFENGPRTD
ncbi:21656_t:CDS:1 [Gigaspora rosea]|nr:21656_t:CDS:1 [Gigaspora rosea]